MVFVGTFMAACNRHACDLRLPPTFRHLPFQRTIFLFIKFGLDRFSPSGCPFSWFRLPKNTCIWLI